MLEVEVEGEGEGEGGSKSEILDGWKLRNNVGEMKEWMNPQLFFFSFWKATGRSNNISGAGI